MYFGACFKQNLTRRNSIKLALTALCARCLPANQSTVATAQLPNALQNIPLRDPQALTGSQFAESVSNLDRPQRENAILSQLLQGNVPGFLRQLVPVTLNGVLACGKNLAATIFVMPEYLAIGSDSNFLRIPMDLHTAKTFADHFRFVLPTKKMVDAIYAQSTSQFAPQPLPAGPRMRSTEYYQTHNAMIDRQSQTRGFFQGALVAGHKKDVVLTNRLRWKPGRIAIYGWHRAVDAPIQPLSTVHGATYADYSHGIRAVSHLALIEGKLRSVYDILQDSVEAVVLSDEGTIRVSSVLANA